MFILKNTFYNFFLCAPNEQARGDNDGEKLLGPKASINFVPRFLQILGIAWWYYVL